MKKEKPEFFRWAFYNNLTKFFIFISFIIAYIERHIEIPSAEIINGTISYGTEFVVSWLKFSKVFIFLLIGYGIVRFGIYYLEFIMKEE